MDIGGHVLGGEGSREKPLNREPKTHDLIQSFITPTDSTLYDRNHGPVPDISPTAYTTHTVTITTPSTTKGQQQSTTLTPQDLATKYPQHKVICALQCAGNRRHAMRTRLKEVQGIDWFDGAILNAEWEGPLLKDVLERVGGKTGAAADTKELHVAFACYQVKTQGDDWYGASVPLERVMREGSEVILALKMNSELLLPKHGYPVRAIVPGVIGARSVKWLDHISISPRESQNYYQQHDYKILPPDATDSDSAAKYWSKIPPMMDNVINSVVADPEDNETVHRDRKGGTITVKGYAVPQGDSGPVVKVEVSTDGGGQWYEAKLGPATRYSWVLWEIKVPIEQGDGKRIFSRATDREGNTQTEERSQWNLRGVGYSGMEGTVGLRVT